MPGNNTNTFGILRPVRILLPLILFFLFPLSCTPPDEHAHEQERWTSSDPLAIQLRARQQKFHQGNLVPNPSFEEGRFLLSDSMGSTPNIDGWTLIGKGVKWLKEGNVSVSYDSTEVFSGTGSIRIYRSEATETEPLGHGVLSDYIKVIPGNYRLSMRINLRDIINPKSRLGVRLYDAIEIKLIYYDKNRIRIDADFADPVCDTRVNNSLKSISLANFTSIDSTGWLHVIGQSCTFPFQDGDLQDDTKFVRIFIGLKGNGTMWVDDVALCYTRWNFTMLERLKPFFDSTLVKSKLIIPQPQKVDILESLIYYRPFHKEDFPLILVPLNVDETTMQAAQLLEKRIKSLLVKHTEFQEDDIPTLITAKLTDADNDTRMIYSLGDTRLFRDYRSHLPLDKISVSSKGYFIYSMPDRNNIIFLYGNRPIGTYFASQVVTQLFDEKKLIFHNANVIDYPENEHYAVLLREYSDLSDAFISTVDKIRFGEIYLPGVNGRTDEITAAAGNLQNVSIWYFYPWNRTEENQQVYEKIERDVRHKGPEGIALIDEDLLGEVSMDSSIISRKNKVSSGTNKFADQRLSELLKLAASADVKVELMPKFHSNQDLIGILNAPICCMPHVSAEGAPVIWSGNAFQTWRLDEADFAFFNEFFGGSKALLDLSLYTRSKELDYFAMDSAWPYKLQTACLFEPFSNEILPGVYNKLDKTIIGFELVSDFDRIRLQTASDYFWNPSGYDPDLSIYRALVSEYGEELAQDLIYFNDYYFKLKTEFILAQEMKNTNKHQRKIALYLREIELVQNAIQAEAENSDHSELFELTSHLLEEWTHEIRRVFPVLQTE